MERRNSDANGDWFECSWLRREGSPRMNTPALTSAPAIAGETRKSVFSNWLRALGPFLGLALVIATFAIMSGNPARYLSIVNLRIVLTQTVIVALGAIGMTIIIISAGIDLSVGSVIALSGVVAAIALRARCAPSIAFSAGLLFGVLGGGIN